MGSKKRLPQMAGGSASALSLSSCPPAYHRPPVDETVVLCLRVVSTEVGLSTWCA